MSKYVLSNHLQVVPAESNWVKLSQAKSGWVELSRAESNWVKLSRAESSWVELSRAESSLVKLSQAESSWVELFTSKLAYNFWTFSCFLYQNWLQLQIFLEGFTKILKKWLFLKVKKPANCFDLIPVFKKETDDVSSALC